MPQALGCLLFEGMSYQGPYEAWYPVTICVMVKAVLLFIALTSGSNMAPHCTVPDSGFSSHVGNLFHHGLFKINFDF